MPNYVRNRLTIGSRVDEVREFIRSDTWGVIDFNKIEPMPEIVKNTISGSCQDEHGKIIRDPVTKTIKAEGLAFIEVGNGLKKTSDGWYLSGNPFQGKDTIELWRPATMEEIVEFRKIGARTWYDWANIHWGTKWNAMEAVATAKNVIEFDTAWSGVTELLKRLSARFPDVVFEYSYADEDTGRNCASGTIKGGTASMHYPDGGSREAYELAFDLWPDNKDSYELVSGNYRYKEEDL